MYMSKGDIGLSTDTKNDHSLEREVNLGLGKAGGLSALEEASARLGATDAASPGLVDLSGAVEVVGLGSTDKSSKRGLVRSRNIGDGAHGGSLLADGDTDAGLAGNDDVGDTHLAAEGGEEDNELNGVNVVGDDL